MKTKIGSWFFILLLFCGMILIFSPNMVASTYTTGFEDGTVAQDYDGTWLDTVETGNVFEVDNSNPRTGVRHFTVKQTSGSLLGTWTFTYLESYDYINFSGYIAYESGDSDDYNFEFRNSTGGTIVHLMVDINTVPSSLKISYIDHLANTVEIDTVEGTGYTKFGFDLTADDTVSYFYNGTCIVDSPVNISDDFRIVDALFLPDSGNTYGTYFDDLMIIALPAGSVGNALGNTTINVYNESDPSVAIPNWNLLVYDEYGGIYYSHDNLNNPVTINHSVYGTGETYFQIGADGYDNRTYYADIVNGIHYILNAFLPYENDTELYYIQVVDERAAPIYNAEIHITKALNGSLQEICSGFTNTYGMYSVYLISSNAYRINISKTDYETKELQELVPDPDKYGIEFPIIYQLGYSSTSYLNETFFNEYIDFTVEESGTTLFTNYTDSLTNTTNTSIVVYEINQTTGDYTPIDWYNTTDDDSWVDTTTINRSNCYMVVLFLNHTDFGFYSTTIFICGDNLTYRGLTDSDTFNRMFDLNYGYNPFGWSNTFAFFVMISILFSFGQMNSGVSMTILGFVLLFINGVIGLALIAVLVPILFILLGLMIMWSSHRRVPG